MQRNSQWSTAYKNRLPDSAFFYVDKSCVERKDSQGRSHPLSCRHFPYKNHQGNVSVSHVRNAISRAPQSKFPVSVQREVQNKARKVLEREGSMAANARQVVTQEYKPSDHRLADGFYRVTAPSITIDDKRLVRGQEFEIRAAPMHRGGPSVRQMIPVGDRYGVRLSPPFEAKLQRLSQLTANSSTRWQQLSGAGDYILSVDGEDIANLGHLPGTRERAAEMGQREANRRRTTVVLYQDGQAGIIEQFFPESTPTRKGSRGISGITRNMRKTSSGSGLPSGGMGKFDTKLDEAVYEVTLEGFADDEVGDASGPPGTHASLLRDGMDLANHLRSQGTSLEAVRWLEANGSAGCIVFIDDSGFVQVVYYDNTAELDQDWNEAVAQLSIGDE